MTRWLILFLLLLSACTTQTPTPGSDPLITLTPSSSTTPLQIEPTPSLQPSPTETSTPIPAKPTLELERQPVHRFPDPAPLHWNLVADGFQKPLDLTHAGDDRLFVVEQAGLIHILKDGQRLPTPYLDIRDRVNDNASERGLLGLAFHPNYFSNGKFFVNYTGENGETVISRFQVSNQLDLADPDSELVILRLQQPYANHNGGGLKFGPDGMLYIGTGDGGSGGDPLGNGQRLDTLLGKILRIDVDREQPYDIPLDNPYVSGGGLPEIWAYGLRNPWRFSFDRISGDLFIGDVGQNVWEEINYQPAGSPGGENYGWNLREGSHPFSSEITTGLIDPVAEYPHDFGCSVTGGVVLQSPSLPSWNGIYLYGDYCTGIIWGLLQTEDGFWEASQLFTTPFTISSFGEGFDGEVFVLDYFGAIYQLSPTN
jgi:glucose/arabinose dehydrogenase